VTVCTDEVAFRDLGHHAASTVPAVSETHVELLVRAGPVIEMHRFRVEDTATVGAGLAGFLFAQPLRGAPLQQSLLAYSERPRLLVIRAVVDLST
jgi:hypothetical protein